ncbi:MAG: MarR family transcriptional regulator [Acidimicrobiia bacterium]|nr:MarR family transcriptional regulator [Acidimicrobiia bacterium]
MPDDLRLRTWRMLLTAHAAVVSILSAEMEEGFGIPLGWYEVLLYLHEAEGNRLRMSELAESLLLSRSAATRFVDRMQDAGLVRRESDASDGRGTNVVMTPEGSALFGRAAPVHLAGIRRHFTDHLGDAEAAAMLAALGRVVEPSGGDGGDGTPR